MKKRIRAAMAAGLVLLAALVLAAPPPAHADGTLTTAQCSPQFVHYWGSGPTRQTSAGFTQQVELYYCQYSRVFYGAALVQPNPGYQASHVQACSMHIGLVDEQTGWHQERAFPCTDQARSGREWRLSAATGWVLPVIDHRYHLTGYVNIRTSVYRGTYDQASRYGFRW